MGGNGLSSGQFSPPPDTYSAYHRDGAVLLKSVIGEPWISDLRVCADQSLSRADNYFHRQRVWETADTCRDYCLDSVAPAIAAAFMDSSKVNLLYDQVFAKSAGDPATPWHNDLPYWPVRNGRAITVWLALDRIGFNAGPLEFIAGSHLWEKWYQPFTVKKDGSQDDFYKATETQFEPLPDFEAERANYNVISWEMEPGDVILFDGMTVHGAKANTSTGMRRGYAVRYTGDGMTYHSDKEVNQIIVNPHLEDGQLLDSEQYPAVHFRA
ncbi:MAG: phytanoyl-CoA dioxygenase family protein [Acidiferrobacterales bacterium]|nr:phytanoyl-CoA dioxygenase family protein [Acidiferrobacterales bacterium]